MLRSRILIGAALAAVALAPTSAGAKQRAPKGPFLTVEGKVSRTSVVRSRCPIVSSLRAFSIETTTTTYTYTFKGASPKGRDRGGIGSQGETTYLYVREVEGESEYVKPQKMGPTRRSVGGQESTFGSAVNRVRGQRGGWVLSIDFKHLAGGLTHSMTVPVPRRGSAITHLVSPDPVTRRDPNPAPGCTHSEEITVNGTVTVGQR